VVHSNLENVELFLNGESLGAKEVKRNSHVAWNVRYTRAVSRRAATAEDHVLTDVRETTGPAAILVMTADRQELAADGEECATLAVEVRDAQGRLVPVADNEVRFEVSGTGKLIGVGNAIPPARNPTRAPHGGPLAASARHRAGDEVGRQDYRIRDVSGFAAGCSDDCDQGGEAARQVPTWEREAPAGRE